MNRDEIKQLIEDIVTLALAKFNERNGLADIKDRMHVAETILTGGDDPSKGLVYLFRESEVQRLEDRKAFARFQAASLSIALIMLGLFLTSVWNNLVVK